VRFANGLVEVGPTAVVAAGNSLHGKQAADNAPARRTIAFAELITQAYMARVQLWSDGFYATPGLHWDKDTLQGKPFYYYAYGAAVSEVVVDTLDRRVEAAARRRAARRRPLAEPGRRHRPGRGRLHPGHGLADDGRAGLASAERPADDARAEHLQDPDRERLPGRLQRAAVRGEAVAETIHRSKATGEPPLLLPFSVFYAIRDAVSAAGDHRVDPPLTAPATSEAILRAVTAVQAG
jgi:xanthine dehydrogenase large subunit